MKFNFKAVKSIKTRQIRNFVNSPAGFLTTLVVGGVVLAAAAKVGDALTSSIERRKAHEEMERNTIDNDEVILAHIDDATGEQPIIVDPEAKAPVSDTLTKVGNILM
nr:MAG TPA: hypothetical protein [Caudoviricetes sp.]